MESLSEQHRFLPECIQDLLCRSCGCICHCPCLMFFSFDIKTIFMIKTGRARQKTVDEMSGKELPYRKTQRGFRTGHR